MLQKIAKSKSFDLLGVLIVVAISIASGYLTETLADVTHWGHWTVLRSLWNHLDYQFDSLDLFNPADRPNE